MATYAIGDIQGCARTLERLLARIDFSPGRDRLWLVGDLVNRGPESLAVLRWAEAFSEHLVCVLGNHDLHLLAVAAGVRRPRRGDTLDAVLAADDCEHLLGWLRRRPLAHADDMHLLVHAGLAPAWTAADALAQAAALEAGLRLGDGRELLAALETPAAGAWSETLAGPERLSTAAAFLTRVRLIADSGARVDDYKGEPAGGRHLGRPWFDHSGRRSRSTRVVCGHWAALGLCLRPDVAALDSGCVWGQALSALRLEDDALFQEPCADRV